MYYGWLQDKIWQLKRSNWYFLSELPWCLVTCIDSEEDMESSMTAKKMVESKRFCSFLGSGLLVGEGMIGDVGGEQGLFSGFDEIWLYRDRPTVEKPKEVSIIPPPHYLSKDPPSKELLEWFNASGCILGLGDGVGMNYVTISKEIVESLDTRQREFESGVRDRGCIILCEGWVQDSIRGLIESHWQVFDELPYALVTCVGGSDDLKSMIVVRKIVALEDSCSFLSGSLLVGDGRIVEVAQRYNLFSHFDEIWLFEESPALDKPAEFWLLAPLNLSRDDPSCIDPLEDWFIESGCVVGLGDGMGMNYLTIGEGIADSLHTHQHRREY